MDAFIKRCLEHTTAAVPSGPAGEPPPPNDPPETENPQWTALSEQLSELQRRRDEMLTDRTAAHPEVQHIGIRIAAIVQRLAATPRTLRAKRSDQNGLTGERHPAQPPRLIDAGPTPQRPTETIASEEYRELREAARRARDEHQRALSSAREAWQTGQLRPQIELVLAEVSKPSEPRFGGSLVLASLAAGAGTAGGAAMVSVAAATVPALTTVAEVEAALPVPIVGTIPATDPADRMRKARRRSRLIRWMMLLGGLLLIAVCVGGVLTAWAAPQTG